MINCTNPKSRRPKPNGLKDIKLFHGNPFFFTNLKVQLRDFQNIGLCKMAVNFATSQKSRFFFHSYREPLSSPYWSSYIDLYRTVNSFSISLKFIMVIVKGCLRQTLLVNVHSDLFQICTFHHQHPIDQKIDIKIGWPVGYYTFRSFILHCWS